MEGNIIIRTALLVKLVGIILLLTYSIGLAEITTSPTLTSKSKKYKFISKLNPGVSLQYGYDNGNYFKTSPFLELDFDFSSASGKKIGSYFGYAFGFREFLTEENIISDYNIIDTNNIRDFTNLIIAGFWLEFTPKISASINGSATWFRTNTWQQESSDLDFYYLSSSLNFKPLEKTSLSFYYGISVANALHSPIVEGGYALFGNAASEFMDDRSPSSYNEASTFSSVPTVDVCHEFGTGFGQSFRPYYAPKFNAGYSIRFSTSNEPMNEVLYAHTFNIGLTQNLWKKASAAIGYAIGITEMKNKMSMDGLYYSEMIPHSLVIIFSQGINKYVSASAFYSLFYTDSNDGAYGPTSTFTAGFTFGFDQEYVNLSMAKFGRPKRLSEPY